MVSGNDQEYLVKVELSKEEQQAILQHCQLLEPHTQRKIESSSDGAVYLLGLPPILVHVS